MGDLWETCWRPVGDRLGAPGSTGIGSPQRPGESGKSLLVPLGLGGRVCYPGRESEGRPGIYKSLDPLNFRGHFGSTEHGVPPLQASFEVLRCGTLLARLAHSLGTLVQFVPRVRRAPASVRVVRLERDGRRVR